MSSERSAVKTLVQNMSTRDLFLSACRNQQYSLAAPAVPQYWRTIESMRTTKTAAAPAKDYFDEGSLKDGPFSQAVAAKMADFPENTKRLADGRQVDLTDRNASIVLAERRPCVAPTVDFSALAKDPGADADQAASQQQEPSTVAARLLANGLVAEIVTAHRNRALLSPVADHASLKTKTFVIPFVTPSAAVTCCDDNEPARGRYNFAVLEVRFAGTHKLWIQSFRTLFPVTKAEVVVVTAAEAAEAAEVAAAQQLQQQQDASATQQQDQNVDQLIAAEAIASMPASALMAKPIGDDGLEALKVANGENGGERRPASVASLLQDVVMHVQQQLKREGDREAREARTQSRAAEFVRVRARDEDSWLECVLDLANTPGRSVFGDFAGANKVQDGRDCGPPPSVKSEEDAADYLVEDTTFARTLGFVPKTRSSPLLGPQGIAELLSLFKTLEFAASHTNQLGMGMTEPELRSKQIHTLMEQPVLEQPKIVVEGGGSPTASSDTDFTPLSEPPAPQQLLEWTELFVSATTCGRGGVVKSDAVTGAADSREQKFDFEGKRYVLSCKREKATEVSTSKGSPAPEIEMPSNSFAQLAKPLRSSHVEVVRKDLEAQHSEFYALPELEDTTPEPNVARLRSLSDNQLVLTPHPPTPTGFYCSEFVLAEDGSAQNSSISERARRRLRVRLLAAKRYCADNIIVAAKTLGEVSSLHNNLDRMDKAVEQAKVFVDKQLLALPPGAEGKGGEVVPPLATAGLTQLQKSSVDVEKVAKSGVEAFFSQKTSGDSHARLSLHHKQSLQAQTDEALLSAIKTETQYLGLAKTSVELAKTSTVVDNISDSLDLLPPAGMVSMFRTPGEADPTEEAEIRSRADSVRNEMRHSLQLMQTSATAPSHLAILPGTIFFALHKKAKALQLQNVETEKLVSLKQKVKKKRKELDAVMRYMKGPAFKTHAALYQSELFNFDTREVLVITREKDKVKGLAGTRNDGLEFDRVKVTIRDDGRDAGGDGGGRDRRGCIGNKDSRDRGAILLVVVYKLFVKITIDLSNVNTLFLVPWL